MYSMWDAPSDRDYSEQFNPAPEEEEEPDYDLHLDSDDRGAPAVELDGPMEFGPETSLRLRPRPEVRRISAEVA